MYIWGRVGPRVGSVRVRLFVRNRGSGRVNASPGRVGSKKSEPWTTLINSSYYIDNITKIIDYYNSSAYIIRILYMYRHHHTNKS